MRKKVYVVNPNGTDNIPLNLNPTLELPSKCPICETGYANLPLISYFIQSDSSCFAATIYSLHLCPHCEKCFMVTYSASGNYNCLETKISEIFPHPESCTKFPLRISDLSPKFVEIYLQAEKAENSGLSEICGLGYRKALEFLLKDFAIHTHPELAEQIKSAPLNQCIKKYISAENIRTLAERSAWLGNDEAHYIKKHNDRDVSDMKSFVEACVYFISMTLVTEDASSMVPK